MDADGCTCFWTLIGHGLTDGSFHTETARVPNLYCPVHGTPGAAPAATWLEGEAEDASRGAPSRP